MYSKKVYGFQYNNYNQMYQFRPYFKMSWDSNDCAIIMQNTYAKPLIMELINNNFSITHDNNLIFNYTNALTLGTTKGNTNIYSSYGYITLSWTTGVLTDNKIWGNWYYTPSSWNDYVQKQYVDNIVSGNLSSS